MKLVKASAAIESGPSYEEALRLIEAAGRVCYKSEAAHDEQTAKVFDEWTSGGLASSDKPVPECGAEINECDIRRYASIAVSERFVCRMLNSGHETPIEMASAVVVRFIIDRGVSHELVRHRLASMNQECVSGSTRVSRKYTIKDLYDRETRVGGKSANRRLYLRSVSGANIVVGNRISCIMYKGQAATSTVVTRLGYRLRCTDAHEFMREDGTFVPLSALRPGDGVMVNGRPCLLRADDGELRKLYLEDRLAPDEIAAQCGAPITSVRRKLRLLGLPKRINDKHPEKYQRGHGPESVEKMRRSRLIRSRNGLRPWNYRLRESESASVAIQARALRANHHNNQPREKSSYWKGGVGIYASLVPEGPCSLCGNTPTEVHHIDSNRYHNSTSNLIRVCSKCHHKLHFGWHVGTVVHSDTIVSIEPFGIEDVYDIEMRAPLHNYVADGFVVHNSTRYVNYKKHGVEFIIPPWVRLEPGEYVAGQIIESNCLACNCVEKDGFPLEISDEATKLWLSGLLLAEQAYCDICDTGWTPQQARGVLPNSLKTEVLFSANMREWRHIFKLRCNKAAHPQMREVMVPLLEEFIVRWPVLFRDLGSLKE